MTKNLQTHARLMGVSRSAVVKRIKQGKIRAINIHDRWYILESVLETLIKDSSVKRVVIYYARVSGIYNLERQITSLDGYVKKQFPQAAWLLKTLIVN